MSDQACALYGDLVLWLRDRAAELLAGDEGNVEAELERLDALIRGWFFEPQPELYGCAPRDVIWAEQMEQANPVHRDYVDEIFEDDCPVCEFERDRLISALNAGETPDFQWFYGDGGYPLITHYDPEGWDARWAEDDALYEEFFGQEGRDSSPGAWDHPPPSADPRQVEPETFLEFLRQPWLDPAMQKAAQKLVERCDVPVISARAGLGYRRVTQSEAASLLEGLGRQGVNVDALLAQVDSWPYQNIALDWLSEPEQSMELLRHTLEQEVPPDDQEGRIRMHEHRDFILALTSVVPLGARLWLQGWLDAASLGSPAPDDLPF